MTLHMLNTLKKLATGDGCGYHFGTLKALVKRGLAESVSRHDCFGHYGIEYRITDAGLAIVAKEEKPIPR